MPNKKNNHTTTTKVAKLESWLDSVDKKLDKMIEAQVRMFEPNGVCDKRFARVTDLEAAVHSLVKQMKWVQGLLTVIAAAIIKLAFF